jgi:hypothetical protein
MSTLRHFFAVLIVIYFMAILQCGPENDHTRHPVTWLAVKRESPEYIQFLAAVPQEKP